MNWLLIGIGLFIIGIIFIAVSAKKSRREGAPALGQTGYLLGVFGAFAIIAQYQSIGDTMCIFVLLTGIIALVDKVILRKRRREDQAEPGWVEFARGFFPVLLIVFLIRGFVVEPFQIPSSSMRPGLIPGDFILVNKYCYGLRLPFTNQVFIPTGSPKAGEVMVFNYPNDPKINFIKRVIGVPGDRVSYQNKKLTVNKVALPTASYPHLYQYKEDNGSATWTEVYKETYGGKTYDILIEKEYPPVSLANVQEFPDRTNCQYDEEGFTCTVPPGHYFVMGDNRDHSGDSRYWGFVPEKYVVGKAFFVWLNINAFSRMGTVIK
jgi:signal peptidase I